MTATFIERDDPFTVETATGASAGLAHLPDEGDCIVSDYDLPGQSGIEFLETVQPRWVWGRGRGVYTDDDNLEALDGFLAGLQGRRRRSRSWRGSRGDEPVDTEYREGGSV